MYPDCRCVQGVFSHAQVGKEEYGRGTSGIRCCNVRQHSIDVTHESGSDFFFSLNFRTGDLTFSGRLLLRLLEESKGIPIIFAAIMPTGP